MYLLYISFCILSIVFLKFFYFFWSGERGLFLKNDCFVKLSLPLLAHQSEPTACALFLSDYNISQRMSVVNSQVAQILGWIFVQLFSKKHLTIFADHGMMVNAAGLREPFGRKPAAQRILFIFS
jgi:hypothetical protein